MTEAEAGSLLAKLDAFVGPHQRPQVIIMADSYTRSPDFRHHVHGVDDAGEKMRCPTCRFDYDARRYGVPQ